MPCYLSQLYRKAKPRSRRGELEISPKADTFWNEESKYTGHHKKISLNLKSFGFECLSLSSTEVGEILESAERFCHSHKLKLDSELWTLMFESGIFYVSVISTEEGQ